MSVSRNTLVLNDLTNPAWAGTINGAQTALTQSVVPVASNQVPYIDHIEAALGKLNYVVRGTGQADLSHTLHNLDRAMVEPEFVRDIAAQVAAGRQNVMLVNPSPRFCNAVLQATVLYRRSFTILCPAFLHDPLRTETQVAGMAPVRDAIRRARLSGLSVSLTYQGCDILCLPRALEDLTSAELSVTHMMVLTNCGYHVPRAPEANFVRLGGIVLELMVFPPELVVYASLPSQRFECATFVNSLFNYTIVFTPTFDSVLVYYQPQTTGAPGANRYVQDMYLWLDRLYGYEYQGVVVAVDLKRVTAGFTVIAKRGPAHGIDEVNELLPIFRLSDPFAWIPESWTIGVVIHEQKLRQLQALANKVPDTRAKYMEYLQSIVGVLGIREIVARTINLHIKQTAYTSVAIKFEAIKMAGILLHHNSHDLRVLASLFGKSEMYLTPPPVPAWHTLAVGWYSSSFNLMDWLRGKLSSHVPSFTGGPVQLVYRRPSQSASAARITFVNTAPHVPDSTTWHCRSFGYNCASEGFVAAGVFAPGTFVLLTTAQAQAVAINSGARNLIMWDAVTDAVLYYDVSRIGTLTIMEMHPGHVNTLQCQCVPVPSGADWLNSVRSYHLSKFWKYGLTFTGCCVATSLLASQLNRLFSWTLPLQMATDTVWSIGLEEHVELQIIGEELLKRMCPIPGVVPAVFGIMEESVYMRKRMHEVGLEELKVPLLVWLLTPWPSQCALHQWLAEQPLIVGILFHYLHNQVLSPTGLTFMFSILVLIQNLRKASTEEFCTDALFKMLTVAVCMQIPNPVKATLRLSVLGVIRFWMTTVSRVLRLVGNAPLLRVIRWFLWKLASSKLVKAYLLYKLTSAIISGVKLGIWAAVKFSPPAARHIKELLPLAFTAIPQEKFDMVQAQLKPMQNGYPMGVSDGGQLKLLNAETPFLLGLPATTIVIVVGASPGQHWTKLAGDFPHLQFIAYDPKPMAVKVDYPNFEFVNEMFTIKTAELHRHHDKLALLWDARAERDAKAFMRGTMQLQFACMLEMRPSASLLKITVLPNVICYYPIGMHCDQPGYLGPEQRLLVTPLNSDDFLFIEQNGNIWMGDEVAVGPEGELVQSILPVPVDPGKDDIISRATLVSSEFLGFAERRPMQVRTVDRANCIIFTMAYAEARRVAEDEFGKTMTEFYDWQVMQLRDAENMHSCYFSFLEGVPGSRKSSIIRRIVDTNTAIVVPTRKLRDEYISNGISRVFTFETALLHTTEYDSIIVDEAPMLGDGFLELLIAVVKPKFMLVVGDMEQMHCYVTSEMQDAIGEKDETTLFRVHGHITLKMTWRIAPNVAALFLGSRGEITHVFDRPSMEITIEVRDDFVERVPVNTTEVISGTHAALAAVTTRVAKRTVTQTQGATFTTGNYENLCHNTCDVQPRENWVGAFYVMFTRYQSGSDNLQVHVTMTKRDLDALLNMLPNAELQQLGTVWKLVPKSYEGLTVVYPQTKRDYANPAIMQNAATAYLKSQPYVTDSILVRTVQTDVGVSTHHTGPAVGKPGVLSQRDGGYKLHADLHEVVSATTLITPVFGQFTDARPGYIPQSLVDTIEALNKNPGFGTL